MDKLWKHQQQIVDTLWERKKYVANSFIASGKTWAALVALNQWLEQNPGKKALVLAPSGVVRNHVWSKEAKKRGFEFSIVELDQPSTKLRAAALSSNWDVVVSNYEGFWRKGVFDELRQQTKGGFAIYDEVHRLKAPNGKGSKKAALLNGQFDYILGLTGSLVPNGYKDLYGIGRAVNPAYFGTRYDAFKARYCIMGGPTLAYVKGYVRVEELMEFSSKLVLTIENKREDGGRLVDLPPEIFKRVEFDLDKKEREAYSSMKEEYLTAIGQTLEEFIQGGMDGNYVAAANVLATLVKLRQIASGFVYGRTLLDQRETFQIGSSRLDALKELLEDVGEEPFIIWYNFEEEYRQIRTLLTRLGITTTTPQNLQNWQDGKYQALLYSFGATTEGVDCTRSSLNILYSPTYDWQQYIQGLGRTVRPNQQAATVRHIQIFAKDTLDTRIYRVLKLKDDMNKRLNKETTRGTSETDGHPTG